jgi:hypothetical protein
MFPEFRLGWLYEELRHKLEEELGERQAVVVVLGSVAAGCRLSDASGCCCVTQFHCQSHDVMCEGSRLLQVWCVVMCYI